MEIASSDSVLPRQSLPRSDRDSPASYAGLFPVYADCRTATRYRSVDTTATGKVCFTPCPRIEGVAHVAAARQCLQTLAIGLGSTQAERSPAVRPVASGL